MTTSAAWTLLCAILTTAMILSTVCEMVRTDPAGFRKSLKIAGAYVVYCGVGIALVLWRVDANPDTNGLAVLVFLMAWILFGVLWLARLVPRPKKLPAWVDRFGVLDWILLAAIAVSTWGCLV